MDPNSNNPFIRPGTNTQKPTLGADRLPMVCKQCRRAHSKCDRQRPCQRCKRLGLELECCDPDGPAPPKRRPPQNRDLFFGANNPYMQYFQQQQKMQSQMSFPQAPGLPGQPGMMPQSHGMPGFPQMPVSTDPNDPNRPPLTHKQQQAYHQIYQQQQQQQQQYAMMMQYYYMYQSQQNQQYHQIAQSQAANLADQSQYGQTATSLDDLGSDMCPVDGQAPFLFSISSSKEQDIQHEKGVDDLADAEITEQLRRSFEKYEPKVASISTQTENHPNKPQAPEIVKYPGVNPTLSLT